MLTSSLGRRPQDVDQLVCWLHAPRPSFLDDATIPPSLHDAETGRRLGAYEIVALIGAGGMGEVYRARDVKLGRDVALKILPAGVAQDRDRATRFIREAQILAALNHPHIGAIYGLEEACPDDDHGLVQFLLLEFVDGETLAARIDPDAQQGTGPPLDQALTIARQIAEAVGTAHDTGVIRRDLKPDNVMIRRDSIVRSSTSASRS